MVDLTKIYESVVTPDQTVNLRDGTEIDDMEVTKLRFSKDDRIERVRDLFHVNKKLSITLVLGTNSK